MNTKLFRKKLRGMILRDATDVFGLVLKQWALTVGERNQILAHNSRFAVILERKFTEALEEVLDRPATSEEATPAA